MARPKLNKDTWVSDQVAMAWFERAAELDPGYAEAYVGMGSVHWKQCFSRVVRDPPQGLGAAENPIQESLETQPELNPGTTRPSSSLQ